MQMTLRGLTWMAEREATTSFVFRFETAGNSVYYIPIHSTGRNIPEGRKTYLQFNIPVTSLFKGEDTHTIKSLNTNHFIQIIASC